MTNENEKRSPAMPVGLVETMQRISPVGPQARTPHVVPRSQCFHRVERLAYTTTESIRSAAGMSLIDFTRNYYMICAAHIANKAAGSRASTPRRCATLSRPGEQPLLPAAGRTAPRRGEQAAHPAERERHSGGDRLRSARPQRR